MIHPARAAMNGHFGRNGNRKLSFFSLVLAGLFVCQFVMLCYFNLTQLRNHLGYDSSWNFLKAALMWQEKALMSPNWGEISNLNLDTHLIPVSLLYGATGNLFLSYGIGNILMVILLLMMMWKILGRMRVQFGARMIALNLMISPYLTTEYYVFNDLGYFSNILSGASFYSLRILVVLMIIYEFLKIVQEQKFGFLPWIIWPFCALCGFSSGVYLLVVLLAPYLVYELEMTVIRNDWRQLIRKESVFGYICCAAVAAGKLLAGKLVGFNALDSTFTRTSIRDLWINLGAVVQGFLKLFQALPTLADDKPLMTVAGLARIFILAVFAIAVAAVVFMIRQAVRKKENSGISLFLTNILLVHLLTFSLFNARYGTYFIEERYLIVAFLTVMIMTALFFDRLDSRRVLSAILFLTMTGSVFMVDVHADYNYLRTTNDGWPLEEIQTLAEKHDAGIVYFWGYDLNVIRRVMRACDLNRIYKEIPDEGGYYTHWDDYYYYDTNEEYSGPTLLLFIPEHHPVSESVLSEFTYLDTLEYELQGTAGHMDVYVSDHNPKLW